MPTTLKIYSDGGSRGNPGPSACAFVVIDNGRIVHKESKFLGKKTNNEAEYFGVISALEWLKNNKNFLNEKRKVSFYLDSELVTRQVLGIYRVRVNNLKPLFLKVKNIIQELEIEKSFFSVPREKNKLSDALVNMEIDENYG
jgi:ribonuclease HI